VRRWVPCCAARPRSSTPRGVGSNGSAAPWQAGICAAGCLYALDHHVERLAEDHANARLLARGLAQIEGFSVRTPQTNLVFVDTHGTGQTAPELAERLRAEGLLVSTVGPRQMRVCTHLDVSRAEVEEAVSIVRRVLLG
jgi:threonine aldolase